ncbi:MAG: putative ABC transport system permease protein [Candidatus Paceibacteria bacterium]|jgi:putative ABC transport system permease protein
MSGVKLIFLYSWRIVRREWRRFALSLSSLAITSVVLMLILLLTGASANLLADQARELQGGDVVLESSYPIAGEGFFVEAGISPLAASEQIAFSGTLQSVDVTAPFTIEVIDDAYPLYGELILQDGVFTSIADGEILLDEAGLKRLGVEKGDTVSFGDVSLTISDVVLAEPTSLFGGFRFLPIAFMSQGSFIDANVDPELLRAEYTYAAVAPDLTTDAIESLRMMQGSYPEIHVDIAGQDQRGLQFGLATVSDFLIIAVLITAVLAAVNVYASVLYLVTIERKSLAVLLALGLTKTKLVYVLGAALGYVVVLANLTGLAIGAIIFQQVQSFVMAEYLIALPTPNLFFYAVVTSALILLISIMSFLPAIRKSLSLNPKQILIGTGSSLTEQRSFWSLVFITVSTLVPLVALATFLLKSLTQGVFVVGAIVLVYVVVATLYTFFIRQIYKLRLRAPFFLRSIISQKYADGLFGVVSFTSLFVALTALCVLSLLQVSLERFLVNDLGETVPSTYVLDVQPSQKDQIELVFPELELFSNIRARLIAIDDVMIQEEIEAGNSDVSGELAREFNLTARRDLLSSESVSSGAWSGGAPGEISVDEDFADQANISLGSTIKFFIQGFEVSGTVTSFRSTDSRSGLPFFYFVLSPEDIGQFPGVYFGYSYYEPKKQVELGRFLASEMPNVSMIETQSLGPLLLQIVGTLMVLVLIVTIPPLLIATLLIAMLVVSSYATRRREGARFRALGLSRRESFWQYLLETVSLTIIASVLAYGLGLLASALISANFLQLESTVLFDGELIAGLGLIIFFIMGIALYLYKTDTMPLRELLSYE